MPQILQGPHILETDENNRILTVDGQEKRHVTDVLAELGLSKSYDGVDTFYADRGRAVHLACRYFNEGVLDDSSVSEVIRPFVENYKKFVRETGFVYHAGEIPLYSALHDYCGTIDLVGNLPDRQLGIFEIKSSSSLDPSVEVQTDAQKILWNEENISNPAIERYVIQLTEDDYRLKKLESGEGIFLPALKVHGWKMSHKRKKKGANNA